MALRRIFGRHGEEMIQEWTKVRNVLFNIHHDDKTKEIRPARYVACLEDFRKDRGKHIYVCP
jgi:hypothetical protein